MTLRNIIQKFKKLNNILTILKKRIQTGSINQTRLLGVHQFTLTPSTLGERDEKGDINKSYQTVLDLGEKLSDKHVKNIALTGPYGSGKSSILLTLQERFPEYEYLSISLATLDCPKEDISDHEEDNSSKTPIRSKEESLNRLIEYSILQQLIYREEDKNIPHSRFKRIKHINSKQSLIYSIGIILFLLACCVLFDPKFLKVQTLYDIFTCGTFWKRIWDILCLFYILYCIGFLLKKIIISTYNNKINKINVKDGEINIAESTSIFNKHLDEIIYFFEVTPYDVVIIEDLDRFETHNIFLKLRELNHLINSSKAIKRKERRNIVFIYAVRDDIFTDTSRTKFFDYIATVIPVINPSNSCDKLVIALKEHKISDISDDVCRDLGIYIDDMRILKNIVNEYIQYRYRLDDKLEPKMLLAMILYKNYYPKDFAELHNQGGIVYNVIKNKAKYYQSAVTRKEDEITSLQDELKQITSFYSTQKEKELRTLYIMKCNDKYGSIIQFHINGHPYSLRECIDSPELFSKLENNEISGINTIGGYRNINFNFQIIEKDVDPKYTYRQRLGMNKERLNEINHKIVKLQQEIVDYRALSLSSILNKYSAEDFYKDVNEINLIAFLLKQGYIDENYYDYLSYFYPGTMTRSDRDFILNIKIGIKKEYTYEIQKPKAVVEQLPIASYKNGLMLNINLVDFIATNKDEYEKQLNWIINYIRIKKEFNFIISFFNYRKETSLFFNDLISHWDDFFKDGVIKQKENEELSDSNFLILLRHFPASKVDHYNNYDFRSYTANKLNFIFSHLNLIGIEKAKSLTCTLKIKYKNMPAENVSIEFMEFIIKGNYYELSNDNLFAIINYKVPELVQSFFEASYSTILKSDIEEVIEYVNANIQKCIESIFPETSKNENEAALISIAQNENIDIDIKGMYLTGQTKTIKDLNSVDQEYWDLVLKCNIVSATWKNVAEYFSNSNELTQILTDFISINSFDLGNQNTSDQISKEIESMLFTLLLGSNILIIESYRQIKKAFNWCFNKTDIRSLEIAKVECLIETGGIKLNEYYYNLMENNFPNLTCEFLLKNKIDYLNDISKYPIKANTTFAILNTSQLTNREKVLVIESLPNASFEGHSALSDLICSILCYISKTNISNEKVIALMNSAEDFSLKLNLFLKQIVGSKCDSRFIKNCLIALGGNYSKIGQQRGHRPYFKKNREHRILAETLLKNEFISKYTEEKDSIRINARNIHN